MACTSFARCTAAEAGMVRILGAERAAANTSPSGITKTTAPSPPLPPPDKLPEELPDDAVLSEASVRLRAEARVRTASINRAGPPAAATAAFTC